MGTHVPKHQKLLRPVPSHPKTGSRQLKKQGANAPGPQRDSGGAWGCSPLPAQQPGVPGPDRRGSGIRTVPSPGCRAAAAWDPRPHPAQCGCSCWRGRSRPPPEPCWGLPRWGGGCRLPWMAAFHPLQLRGFNLITCFICANLFFNQSCPARRKEAAGGSVAPSCSKGEVNGSCPHRRCLRPRLPRRRGLGQG